MLELGARELYLDALRPPAGCRLDQAIATTYSLDLICALMAPIAMTKFAAVADEDPSENWLTGLDALRRTSDRWMIFCQQGKIPVPRRDLPLFRYLEGAINEVNAPGGGVFHPKLWVLRFESDEGHPHYRVLCLSRNLTFDRSLDTILVLEQRAGLSRRNRDETAPLGDFIRALPGMCASPLTPDQTARIERVAREISRVRFQSPEGFRPSVWMWSLGLTGDPEELGWAKADRLLVVSPFVTGSALAKMLPTDADSIVVSREDQLDAVADVSFTTMEQQAEFHVTRDEVVGDDLNEDETAPPTVEDDLRLNGLHAKLYVAEFGDRTRVLTGSANATGPAWSGANVEFMVELAARSEDVSIDAILGPRLDEDHLLPPSQLGLRALMAPYIRPDGPPPDLTIERRLERQLKDARSFLREAALSVKARSIDDGFELRVEAKRRPRAEWPGSVTALCWPVSLQEMAAQEVRPLVDREAVRFAPVTLVALTGMVAFELGAEDGDERMTDRFVLNLPTTGIPEGRDRRILADIIEKSGGFIRYLLMLLADDTDPYDILQSVGDGGGARGDGHERGDADLPLFEELVQALSRDPGKINDINRLVQDLLSGDESNDAIPDGFMDMWPMFLSAIGETEHCE